MLEGFLLAMGVAGEMDEDQLPADEQYITQRTELLVDGKLSLAPDAQRLRPVALGPAARRRSLSPSPRARAATRVAAALGQRSKPRPSLSRRTDHAMLDPMTPRLPLARPTTLVVMTPLVALSILVVVRWGSAGRR
jgi:hypothetical protein